MRLKQSILSRGLLVYPASEPSRSLAPTCLDLFAGAGGLAVGFRDAGWTIVGGNDIDKDAGATFRLNFPEAVFFEGPVSELTSESVMRACSLEAGQLDCLIGGPPCQSFSHNNHRRSEKDERARLFEHYLRLVRGLRPKTLVMENVPGILTIGNGSVIDEITTELRSEELGYKCVVRTLSAEEYGTPQIRRRVFIAATRLGPAEHLIPSPTHRSASPRKLKLCHKQRRLKRLVTVHKAIGDLPSIENGGGQQISGRGKIKPFSGFQREVRKGARKLFNHVCHTLTEVNLGRVTHIPEGGNWRDIPRNLLPAGMRRARLSDHTKRYGRLSRNGLASTLLTKCDPHWGAYIHPTVDRTISVREAARLQGFPDRFRFAGDRLGKHYEQVGNAVPVPVAAAIGTAVAVHLRRKSAFPLDQGETDSGKSQAA